MGRCIMYPSGRETSLNNHKVLGVSCCSEKVFQRAHVLWPTVVGEPWCPVIWGRTEKVARVKLNKNWTHSLSLRWEMRAGGSRPSTAVMFEISNEPLTHHSVLSQLDASMWDCSFYVVCLPLKYKPFKSKSWVFFTASPGCLEQCRFSINPVNG